jgi:hypothetical protein
LADADDDLEWVAQGMRVRDEEGEEEADGAPGKLFWVLSVMGRGIVEAAGEWIVKSSRGEAREGKTNSSDSLHAENEGVRS